MQFEASLLVPTLRRSWGIVSVMPVTVLIAWLLMTLIGILSDIGIERANDSGSVVLIFYGIAITFVQVWLTREVLERAGVVPRVSIVNSLTVYLQGLFIGLGILVGLLLLVLPGLYLFARWYLASVILIRDGGGRRAAMARSWEMLESHWPAALGVGAILFAMSAAPLALDLYRPSFTNGHEFAWLTMINLLSSAGQVGSYLAAVALLLNIEQPASTLQEIFS
ncbi:hypothetical protein [Sphingopyxis sp. H115]|uniref:hypothetical protein n=1 Tax=Sphingopyxis sp. H115 TaxID=1759073 RepID=UPI0007378A5D|nr:hypothetical protein [Sphingopyxis sp. H115]KTE15515.1 hypothetical protein ATE71_07140 [Sphingopyxis sp. H115]